MEHTPTPRPRIVIIGAGFAGLSAAKALRKADVDIEIIDRRNYHLFQPLLYQVATADLSPADIAWPIRSIFSRQRNVTVTLSEVHDIDLSARQVITETGTISYDFLIVASGAHNFYFGNDWADQAPGLKNLRDATSIRRRILLAFERAEVAATPEEQRRQLNFVVVGGGPTGVEMAGAIAELARFTLARDFRRIRPADARVILVEAGPRLLPAFPEELSDKARTSLEKLGVEVWCDTRVEDISPDGVATSAGAIPAATTIWGAGVKVKNAAGWLSRADAHVHARVSSASSSGVKKPSPSVRLVTQSTISNPVSSANERW